jgi:hypothetical protein
VQLVVRLFCALAADADARWSRPTPSMRRRG